MVLGIAFFWWGLRFLIGGRVSYLAALPGAVATVVFLAGLRVFSGVVFEPLIVTNAVSYGALGTVLIVESWLIGVGWVIFGGQLFGRWFHDDWLEARAHSRRGQREPATGSRTSSAPAVKARRLDSRPWTPPRTAQKRTVRPVFPAKAANPRRMPIPRRGWVFY